MIKYEEMWNDGERPPLGAFKDASYRVKLRGVRGFILRVLFWPLLLGDRKRFFRVVVSDFPIGATKGINIARIKWGLFKVLAMPDEGCVYFDYYNSDNCFIIRHILDIVKTSLDPKVNMIGRFNLTFRGCPIFICWFTLDDRRGG